MITSVVRSVVERALLLADKPSVPACEATCIKTVIAMVKAGLGVAVLPSTGLNLQRHPDVRSAPIADRSPVRSVSAIVRKGVSLPPPAASFLEAMKAHFGAQRAAPR